jgi:cytoskeleton protein RodZ
MLNGSGPGALLREWREARGMSIDELSRATRIGPHFLRALEEDRLDDLPAPVFVRGFIRAYCASVAGSAGEALARYDARVGPPTPTPRVVAAVAARPPASPAASPVTRARRRPTARLLAGSRPRTLLIAAVLLVVVGGALYRLAPLAPTAPPPPPPAPVRLPAPLQSPEAIPEASTTPTAAPTTWSAAAPVPAPPSPAPPPHVLVVRAHDVSWVQVRPDDGAVSEALLQPGNAREWRGAERFTVTVGNAGGVSLELDGVALPPLGSQGEVVRNLRLPAESAR